MMRAFWLAFLWGIFGSVGAASALEIYQCSVNKRPQDFIAQTIVFAYEPGAKTALVSDDVTQDILGAPVRARFRERGNRLALNWQLKKVRTGDNFVLPLIKYSATFNRASKKIQVNVAATGYGVDYTESGKCRLLPEAERSRLTALINDPKLRRQVENETESVAKYTYDCTITRKRRFEGVTPDTLRIVIDDDVVTVSDDVMAKIGTNGVTLKIDRVVGDDLLFVWSLKNIPRSMLPKTETGNYTGTVNYRGRLNLESGKFSMVGNSVTGVGLASVGKQMTGTGRCKLQKP